jgi:phage repressor protein C with HTH and peptisase S24 domain
MDKILSPIKERVLQFVDYIGVTKESFFEKTEISASNFKGIGLKSELGGEKIAKILSLFNYLNADWLITGNGEMIKHNPNLNMVSEPIHGLIKTPINKRIKRKLNKSSLIKFYDLDFAAGDIEFYEDNFTVQPTYTMDIPEFNGCTAFRTYNNSMEKLIYSGDILFGTKEDGWQDGLEYGQIYGIVCHNRRKYLKYIRKDINRADTHFLLRSENSTEYDDFSISKDKIKSLWLIHGWLKKRV